MRLGCVATAHHVVEMLDLALHKERPPTLFVLTAGWVILWRNQDVSLRNQVGSG
jgi:hypothetical protein